MTSTMVQGFCRHYLSVYFHRVLLETGEEVVEAPRPADWPADEK